jgi:hypothetical protein
MSAQPLTARQKAAIIVGADIVLWSLLLIAGSGLYHLVVR